jgi:hypothetical protein
VIVGAPGAANGQGVVSVFDLASGQELMRLNAGGNSVRLGRSLSADRDRVLALEDSAAYLFDLRTGALLNRLDAFSGSAVLLGDRAVLSQWTATTRSLSVFDTTSGALLYQIYAPVQKQCYFGTSLDGSDGRLVAGGLWCKTEGNGGSLVFVYDLCEPLGRSYCGPAVPNSTGESARILAFGSAEIARDDLWLAAERMAPQHATIFLGSLTQDFVSGPGGSDGNLCLGGVVRRASKIKSSWSGSGLIRVDFSWLGAMSGETWNFQAWYRDGIMWSSQSNFTDGVSVLLR